MVKKNIFLLAILFCHNIICPMNALRNRAAQAWNHSKRFIYRPEVLGAGMGAGFATTILGWTKFVDGLDSRYSLSKAQEIEQLGTKHPITKIEDLISEVVYKLENRPIPHRSDTERYEQTLDILKNVYKKQVQEIAKSFHTKVRIGQAVHELESHR